MELGQRLRQARQEKGISQRQLCGDTITRNMLSLIENGAAIPSLDTLLFLARQLDKPVSYFLDEQTLTSPNQSVMEKARSFLAEGKPDAVLEALADYRRPDATFDYEAALLEALACILLAEEAISREKRPYARELLERAAAAGQRTPYYTQELERRRLLILAQLVPMVLPADDRELLLRSELALRQGDTLRAAQYLDAAEEKETPRWSYLRGKVYHAQQDHRKACDCFRKAWEYAPKSCAAALEDCCRELGDYKGAYHYACVLRDMEKDETTFRDALKGELVEGM